MKEILVKSSLDGSLEPSLFYRAAAKEPRPLLVGLHTWSFDRHNQAEALLPLCEARGWHLLLPEFRGPNLASNPRAPEACASRLAIQDVLDAAEFAARHLAEVDGCARLLFGASGGEQMALMLAGRAPTYWRAVAAFVPLIDIALWHAQLPALTEESGRYIEGIEACIGGPPNEEYAAQYAARAPIGALDQIAKANVSIFTGKHDPLIPFTQTLDFYNEMVARHPSARCFLHIFDGEHEQRVEFAQSWFDSQLGQGECERATG